MSAPSHAWLSALNRLERLSLTLSFPEHGESAQWAALCAEPLPGAPAPGGLLGLLGPRAKGQAGAPWESLPRCWGEKGTRRALTFRAKRLALSWAGRLGCSAKTRASLGNWGGKHKKTTLKGQFGSPGVSSLQGGFSEAWSRMSLSTLTLPTPALRHCKVWASVFSSVKWGCLLSFQRLLCRAHVGQAASTCGRYSQACCGAFPGPRPCLPTPWLCVQDRG